MRIWQLVLVLALVGCPRAAPPIEPVKAPSSTAARSSEVETETETEAEPELETEPELEAEPEPEPADHPGVALRWALGEVVDRRWPVIGLELVAADGTTIWQAPLVPDDMARLGPMTEDEAGATRRGMPSIPCRAPCGWRSSPAE